MKYIKRINEFFDTEELKSIMKIDYLQGNIPFKEIVKDTNMFKRDPLLFKLINNAPFIKYLDYNRLSSNVIQLGFQYSMYFDPDNDVFLYYVIEIIEQSTTKNYMCNVYAKCIDNGKTIFDKSLKKPIMPYERLVQILNGEVLSMLIEFTRFTYKKFNWVHFPYLSKEDMNMMSGDLN
jgi:hypothetical protein